MDDDGDDTMEVIGQPHLRHQEPPARSPLLSASIQIDNFLGTRAYAQSTHVRSTFLSLIIIHVISIFERSLLFFEQRLLYCTKIT